MRIGSQIRIQLKIFMRIRIQIRGGGGRSAKNVHPPGKILGTPLHRIHMFLGHSDPDLLVRGMDPDPALDPDPDPSIPSKIVRKTLIPTIFLLFLTFYL